MPRLSGSSSDTGIGTCDVSIAGTGSGGVTVPAVVNLACSCGAVSPSGGAALLGVLDLCGLRTGVRTAGRLSCSDVMPKV